VASEAELLLPLVFPLIASSLLGLGSRRAGLPMVVGFVLGGLLVGPLTGLVSHESPTLSFLAELGIILISFEIGITLRLDFFARAGLRALGIIAVELVLVGSLTLALGSLLSIGPGDELVLIFMTVNTSSALAFRLLQERGHVEPAFRELVLAVAAVEDVVALVGLTLFPILARIEPGSPTELARSLLLIPSSIALLLFIGLRYLRRPLEYFGRVGGEAFLAISFALVLAFSYLGVSSGLSSALGAFIAGLVVSNSAVSERVSHELRSIRELSALLFFSSIGASMPALVNPTLFLAGIGIALLAVMLKFLGFSLSSWLLGTDMVEAFRLGLYMTSISEFGIIVAKGALDAGIASVAFYTASVITFTLSALLSSVLVRFEDTLPVRLARIMPLGLRLGLERVSSTLRDALGRRGQGFEGLRSATAEFVRRIAIILVLTLAGNLLIELALSLLPPGIAPFFVAFIALAVASIVIAVALRMRTTFVKLGLGIERGPSSRGARGQQLAALMYTLSLLGIGLWVLAVSYPRLGRLIQLAAQQGQAPIVFFALLAALLVPTLARLRRIATNLERAFGIGGPQEEKAKSQSYESEA
jgi:CPA2 family monovalent cation:H+ antiporter-2